MRTAEDIFYDATLKNLSNPNGTRTDIVIAAINMARKEALAEAESLIKAESSTHSELIWSDTYKSVFAKLIQEIK